MQGKRTYYGPLALCVLKFGRSFSLSPNIKATHQKHHFGIDPSITIYEHHKNSLSCNRQAQLLPPSSRGVFHAELGLCLP